MQISKWLIAFVAVYGGLGGVFFDAILPATARQHIGNPAWPPHAKFHNGQTMALGVLNAVAVLGLLFAAPATTTIFLIAAFVAESYFAAMLIAPVLPGAAWSDPEFDAVNPQPFGMPIQKLLSLLATCVVIVAVAIALA